MHHSIVQSFVHIIDISVLTFRPTKSISSSIFCNSINIPSNVSVVFAACLIRTCNNIDRQHVMDVENNLKSAISSPFYRAVAILLEFRLHTNWLQCCELWRPFNWMRCNRCVVAKRFSWFPWNTHDTGKKVENSVKKIKTDYNNFNETPEANQVRFCVVSFSADMRVSEYSFH